jgi:hypothetical protein
MPLIVSNGPAFENSSWHFRLPKLLRTFVLTTVIVFFFALTACKMSPTPTATPTLRVILTAMAAGLDGKLVEIDGCLRVKGSEQDVGSALVWPPDYEMTIEDGQVRVVSGLVSGERREVILKIGEKVTLSGGIVANLDEQLKGTIPANCPGPYWAVGNTIRPIATQIP